MEVASLNQLLILHRLRKKGSQLLVKTEQEDPTAGLSLTPGLFDGKKRFAGPGSPFDKHAVVLGEAFENAVLFFSQSKEFSVDESDSSPERRAKIEVPPKQ